MRACSLRTHSLAACLTAHAACNHQAGGRDRVRHRRARAHSREPARPRRRSRERAGLCERLLRRLEQGRAKGQLAHSGAAAAAAAAQRWRRCDGALRRRVSSASRRRCSVGPWSSSSTTASPALPDTLTPPCPSSGKHRAYRHIRKSPHVLTKISDAAARAAQACVKTKTSAAHGVLLPSQCALPRSCWSRARRCRVVRTCASHAAGQSCNTVKEGLW